MIEMNDVWNGACRINPVELASALGRILKPFGHFTSCEDLPKALLKTGL